jgi:hypothetical protein
MNLTRNEQVSGSSQLVGPECPAIRIVTAVCNILAPKAQTDWRANAYGAARV